MSTYDVSAYYLGAIEKCDETLRTTSSLTNKQSTLPSCRSHNGCDRIPRGTSWHPVSRVSVRRWVRSNSGISVRFTTWWLLCHFMNGRMHRRLYVTNVDVCKYIHSNNTLRGRYSDGVYYIKIKKKGIIWS